MSRHRSRPALFRLTITSGVVLAAAVGWMPTADAQITAPRSLSATPDPIATLEEQLINRLRATSNEQRAYIKFVIKQVREQRLDLRLVVAIEKKALRRNRFFPFPFFERAMRFEAAKRNVALPPVQQFATTKVLPTATR